MFEKIKIEAIRVQLGLDQTTFLEEINSKISKPISMRAYHNRLDKKASWKLDEANAISVIANVPIDKIDF